MKTAAPTVSLSLLAVLAATILTVPAPPAGATTSAGEARARAIIAAFSAGEPQTLERVAHDHYSAAALARRTPEQRAQALKRVHDEAGALEIVDLKATGDTLVATTKAERGGSAVFTFLLGAPPARRIESVGVQMRGTTPQALAKDPYAPYAFLIGEWETTGGIRQSLKWGPAKSYIWYAVYMQGDAEEQLHQEGLMLFNGQDKTLDFLFVHPGTLSQEQGKVHVEADGSIVRETTAISGDGEVTRFRQTWRQTGPDAAVTSLLRQTADGKWEPTFPGADQLEMTRRPS